MTATFAQFVSEQDARNTIQLKVTEWSLMLCDALTQNFIEYNLRYHQISKDRFDALPGYHQQKIDELKEGICDYEFILESGRKYHKIVMNADGQRSVHCFINRETGEVLKSASWSSPAKGVRYDLRLIEQREWLFENADWAGSYLYARTFEENEKLQSEVLDLKAKLSRIQNPNNPNYTDEEVAAMCAEAQKS